MDFEEELAGAEKTKIRLQARAARDAISADLRRAMNEAISAKLIALPEFAAADAIMAYIAFGSEAYPEQALLTSATAGKKIIVPDHFGLIDVTGLFAKRALPADIDLVLVPGLIFDEAGHRIGYGGGWYDELVTQLRDGVKTVGIAYEEQVALTLPREPHDLRLDLIITDERVINPN
jgi:5-formyltetrahydrofolate cyclo-ligase